MSGWLTMGASLFWTSKYPDLYPWMKNRWQWTPVRHGTCWSSLLALFGRPPFRLLFHWCSSQQCFRILSTVQQMYWHVWPALLNVHCNPFFFGFTNTATGVDVGGGNTNSLLNVSSLPINSLISATSSIILCRSSLSNLCGLAAKCASIWLGNTAY